MTILHHPSDGTLLAYANGSLNAVLAIVVQAHVEGCAKCRETVSAAEALGGIFLEAEAPTELSPGALARVLAQLDDLEAKPAVPPLMQHVAPGSRRWLAPGVWARPIIKGRAQGMRLYLLGASAGKALPRHSHHGIEMTQVLEGEFFDDGVRYGPGDFLEADDGHEHRPVVGKDRDCVCMIASQGTPRGLVGLLMRAFT